MKTGDSLQTISVPRKKSSSNSYDVCSKGSKVVIWTKCDGAYIFDWSTKTRSMTLLQTIDLLNISRLSLDPLPNGVGVLLHCNQFVYLCGNSLKQPSFCWKPMYLLFQPQQQTGFVQNGINE
jgi:hypothetical protein